MAETLRPHRPSCIDEKKGMCKYYAEKEERLDTPLIF